MTRIQEVICFKKELDNIVEVCGRYRQHSEVNRGTMHHLRFLPNEAKMISDPVPRPAAPDPYFKIKI